MGGGEYRKEITWVITSKNKSSEPWLPLSRRGRGERLIVMKKYINPKTIVVELRVTQMLAESIPVIPESEETINNSNQILSREYKSVWEQEWWWVKAIRRETPYCYEWYAVLLYESHRSLSIFMSRRNRGNRGNLILGWESSTFVLPSSDWIVADYEQAPISRIPTRWLVPSNSTLSSKNPVILCNPI